MIPPDEKAMELMLEYYSLIPMNTVSIAKKFAIKAVDLHLEELSKMKLIFSDRELHYEYWKKVKQYIIEL
jgi:hypothetical protein